MTTTRLARGFPRAQVAISEPHVTDEGAVDEGTVTGAQATTET